MMGEGVRIAIVGAGFSGTMTAVGLLRHGAELRIDLIDGTSRFGRGVAYQENSFGVLLNVRASGMSAFADEPNHFVEWLAKHHPSFKASDFVPRDMYGQYLSTLLQSSAERSRGRLTLVADEAVGVRRVGEMFEVQFQRGACRRYNGVVVAIGNLPSQRLPIPAEPGALHPAWSSRSFIEVEKLSKVAVIGTGLTAVDTILTLIQRGYRGGIVAISRRGLLPMVQLPPGGASVVPSVIPRGTLRELLQQLRALSIPECVQLVDSWRAETDALWQSFSDEERRRFLRHLRPYWEVVRHRMPTESALCIEALRRAGRLEVIAARVLRVDRDTQGFTFELAPRRAARRSVHGIERIFDATGPSASVETCQSPFLHSLRTSLGCQPESLGLGLLCDQLGRPLTASGEVLDGVWIVGPLRRGSVWESTAVRELRVQAAGVASSVLDWCTMSTARSSCAISL